jgi:hypothetical protein
MQARFALRLLPVVGGLDPSADALDFALEISSLRSRQGQ